MNDLQKLAAQLPGMSGTWVPPSGQAIVAHPNQTVKQPVVWRCPNPACVAGTLARYFDFEGEYPECPKCGLGPPAVQKRSLIHVLMQDPKGPILGDLGLRYRLACSPSRHELATLTNGEAATGDVSAANCPGCLKVVEHKLKLQFGHAIGLGG